MEIKHTPSMAIFLKSPCVFLKTTPSPKRIERNTFSDFEDVKSAGLISKYVFINYKFATETVLLIKCSC